MTIPVEFADFLQTIELRSIQPAFLQSERLGDIRTDIPEIQMTWTQAFADGDPLAHEVSMIAFRPRYEFVAKQGNVILFRQESRVMVVFHVRDQERFQKLWSIEAVRDAFLQQQILKTVWPLFRQHVHDGMSRLGLQPFTLPFIM